MRITLGFDPDNRKKLDYTESNEYKNKRKLSKIL